MKLTPEYIESQVLTTEFDYNGTFTVCTITTCHGSKHVGTSGCLDPANYDKAIGEQIARKNAVEQLWALEGYFVGKLGLALVPGQLTNHEDVFVSVKDVAINPGVKDMHHLEVLAFVAPVAPVDNKEVPIASFSGLRAGRSGTRTYVLTEQQAYIAVRALQAKMAQENAVVLSTVTRERAIQMKHRADTADALDALYSQFYEKGPVAPIENKEVSTAPHCIWEELRDALPGLHRLTVDFSMPIGGLVSAEGTANSDFGSNVVAAVLAGRKSGLK